MDTLGEDTLGEEDTFEEDTFGEDTFGGSYETAFGDAAGHSYFADQGA